MDYFNNYAMRLYNRSAMSSFEKSSRKGIIARAKSARAKSSRYVYVIASTVGVTKIGVAASPKFRLAGLQIGSPVRLWIFNSIEVSYNIAQEVEACCHKSLAAFHSHGEWFKVSPEAAWECVQKCSQAVINAVAERKQQEELLISELQKSAGAIAE